MSTIYFIESCIANCNEDQNWFSIGYFETKHEAEYACILLQEICKKLSDFSYNHKTYNDYASTSIEDFRIKAAKDQKEYDS